MCSINVIEKITGVVIQVSYWNEAAGTRTKGLSTSIMKDGSHCSANSDR
jgi:hypothetical protein